MRYFNLFLAVLCLIYFCRFIYNEIKKYKKISKRIKEIDNLIIEKQAPIEMLDENHFLKVETLKISILEIITRYDNEKVILEYLTNSFIPLLITEKGIDSLMLRVSRQLTFDGKMADKAEVIENYKKAACLSKRLAHILYRNYKKLDEKYTSPDFLQTI